MPVYPLPTMATFFTCGGPAMVSEGSQLGAAACQLVCDGHVKRLPLFHVSIVP